MRNTTTVEYRNHIKNPTLNTYDDMYNWWHNPNTTFEKLTDNEKLFLILAVNFEVKSSIFTNEEVVIKEAQAHSIHKLSQEEIQEYLKNEDPEKLEKEIHKFHLEDLDQANLSNIEDEVFADFDEILNRLETYFTDYFSEY